MTTSELPHQHPAPSAALLDAVGTAVGVAVRAALDADRDAARLVLRDGAGRESMLTAAQDRAQRGIIGSSRPRTAVAERQLLCDVARAFRQVDDLARLVLTGRAGEELAGSRARRCCCSPGTARSVCTNWPTDSARPSSTGRELTRCGRCLLDAADRLGRHVPGSGVDRGAAVCACCAGLATTVLQVSRHALRAAA
ncbi:hypothetical protein [Nocardioides litoris]|uniref:hypothetical protein n=1 Tax=Nocardioides litoris TaxID=1926648 RepID=UPI0011217BF7|nr:hypothetical protein [Nocardioides litoris]